MHRQDQKKQRRRYGLCRVAVSVLWASLFPLLGCTAPSSSESPPDDRGDAFARQVIELTNRERLHHGVPPLTPNPKLAQAAFVHSRAMAEGNFLNHYDPHTGSSPGDRIRAAGYDWKVAGENVAAGAETPERVVAGWMNSSEHRENILNPAFQDIGVGYVTGTTDFNRCNGRPCRHYWTQQFGRR
jgi:uncharacterized protein YkwD